MALLPFQKLIWIKTRLPQNSPKSSFRHVTGVVGDRRITIGPWIEPDLVTPSRLTVELEAKLFQSAYDFTIPESGEPAHSSGHHDCEVLVFRCRRQGQGAFAFPPRLNQTASNVTGNLQSLSHSAALRN
jgi:hypothetical protein